VRAVTASAKAIFSKGSSTLWFSGKALTAPGTAYVNSTLASAQDLDDGHRQAMGHPGASIIPAAIAVAEETEASGMELLAAIVVGYEVAIRIAAARDHDTLDTLASGRWCGFGAAAAAGRLRGMSPDKLAEAMSIAGSQAPGLSAAGYSSVMGNSVKEGIAWSTLTALCALAPSERGFTGPLDILDHPDYYFSEKIVFGLGKSFAIEQIYFKPYSCCRWIHSAIDALCNIMAEYSLDAEEMTGMDVHLFERALRLNNYPDPDSLEGAQYSIPFCMAVAAIAGKNALLPMRPNLLCREEITGLARKIRLFEDTSLTKMFPETVPARVVVHTKNDSYTRFVKYPEGDPANPMQWQQIENKFYRLSRPYRDFFDAKKVIGMIKNIEDGTIDALVGALGCPVSFNGV
ncbi:MAG: MmgE/PrpD family protein, partial [Deltaproteobacteria bacterium]|nr:MmgE/PrpD family protein [Deltaproteobacteria bacterium]